jgi:putative transposase
MMNWKGLPGHGKALTARWLKRRWHRNLSDLIQQIGEKNGSKRSLLVDAIGIPLSIVVSGAHVHDVKLLEPTLDGIVVERPPIEDPPKEHLCADAGYAGTPAEQAITKRGYVPHVRPRKAEIDAKRQNEQYRARRWVVERSHSWLNRFRKLLVRFEKKAISFEGLLEIACALIVFRQLIPIYG